MTTAIDQEVALDTDAIMPAQALEISHQVDIGEATVSQEHHMLKKGELYPLQLSGGEQQRVAIARAVVNDPLILIADEPTGNLDPDITRDIMVLFRSISLRGTTVIIATHSQELMKDTEQRIIQLKAGRMLKER